MAKIICIKSRQVLADLPSIATKQSRAVQGFSTDLSFSLPCRLFVIAHSPAQAQCIVYTIGLALNSVKKAS